MVEAVNVTVRQYGRAVAALRPPVRKLSPFRSGVVSFTCLVAN